MKKISKKEIQELSKAQQIASQNPSEWESFYSENQKEVILEAPLHILFHPGIRGYVMVWNYKKRIMPQKGAIEVRFSVETSLMTALNVIQETGENCSILTK